MWHTSPRPQSRQAKIEVIEKLDEPREREEFLDAAETMPPDDLSSDDLFTQATLYLRMEDDIQDKLQLARGPERAQLMQRLSEAATVARIAIRNAIDKRNHEPQVAEEPIFHNDAIQQRADEIEQQAAIVAHAPGAMPIIPLPPLPAVAPVPAFLHHHVVRPAWAPDPENVHDSAVGEGVSRRLDYLRTDDLHIFQPNTCIGAVALLMNQRLDKTRDLEKRKKIMQTLEQAQHNSYCDRYKIGELDAMRLVLEHAYHAESEEKKNNLHDAFLNSLADCAHKNTDGTVCLVGRISRYAASMDGVDDKIADVVKPVDAYRVEIFNSVGKVSTTPDMTDEKLRAGINQICDQYKGKIPDRSLQKIREECLAGVD